MQCLNILWEIICYFFKIKNSSRNELEKISGFTKDTLIRILNA